MDKEIIRAATSAARRYHRIDRVRAAVSGQMSRQEFDNTLLAMAAAEEIELTGGNTSGMSAGEIAGLLRDEQFGTWFVNFFYV